MNNDQLSKLVAEKECKIQELDIRIDRIQNELKSSASAHETAEERDKVLQVGIHLEVAITIQSCLTICQLNRLCRMIRWPHRAPFLKTGS